MCARDRVMELASHARLELDVGVRLGMTSENSELCGLRELRELWVSRFFALLFTGAATSDLINERKRSAKSYKSTAEVNNYMHAILKGNGRCEICSRDASWISDKRIFSVLEDKAKRGEVTFLVHHTTPDLRSLSELGAEIIEYGALGFEPVTRFTIVNAGNPLSSYVAIGRKKPNGPHVIEELDSSHPTYSMAQDLIRSIRIAHDQANDHQKPFAGI